MWIRKLERKTTQDIAGRIVQSYRNKKGAIPAAYPPAHRQYPARGRPGAGSTGNDTNAAKEAFISVFRGIAD